MSDPYAGIGTEDPYAGLGSVEGDAPTPKGPAGPDLTTAPPRAALRELLKARSALAQQVRGLPAAAQKAGWDHFNADPRIIALKQAADKPDYGAGDLIASKMTMGLTDKIAPVISAAFDMARGRGFDYQNRQQQQDQARASYQQEHPVLDWATLPTNFMGAGVVSGLAKPTLAELAQTGSVVGGLAAAGNSRGTLPQQIRQTGTGAAVGAITGPAIGVALPYVARGVGAATGRLADLAGMPPRAAQPTASGQILLDALEKQGQTPQQAAAMMSEANRNGVPMALMDTGDETRGLASALARKPGPNRTLIRDVAIPRQEAQAERLQGAITRDLGPVANVRASSEAMMQQAKEKAAPLYEKAYANPVPDSETLQQLSQRPSMRSALKRAYTIAAEEGRDPKAMGFNLDAEGNVTLEKHNSAQTWDYVKRGLDDVLETFRDKTTGRLVLDEGGRAINNTRKALLGELDHLNPDYAAARQAYAGPAAMTTALNKGSHIGSKDAETIWAETRDLSPAELEQYKLGVRSALSKMLEGKPDRADQVKALIGTPKKRKVLAQLFGGNQNFGRLLATLNQEAQTTATYARAAAGSPTAANLADDANLGGITGVGAKAAGRAVMGQDILSNGIATLSDLVKYGAGKSGERLRAELAAGLSETDPRALAAALKAARRAAAARRVLQPGLNAVGKIGTVAGGQIGGDTVSTLGN